MQRAMTTTDDPNPTAGPLPSAQDVWAALERDPTQGDLQRRFRDYPDHDVYFIRLANGTRLVHFVIGGPIGKEWRRARASRGVGVRVRIQTAEKADLWLEEKTHNRPEQFTLLSADLMELLDAQQDRPPGLGILDRLCARIRSWQDFFARDSSALTLEARLGLFGELTTLVEHLQPRLGVEAFDGWTGAERAVHDFEFETLAVEVKAFKAAQPAVVRIHSERQLDALGAGRLYLAVNEFDVRADGEGKTLEELIQRVRGQVAGDPPRLDTLNDRLIAAGYLDEQGGSYEERYKLRRCDVFKVIDSFPRITPAHLPIGVGRVSYDLSIASCSPWAIEWDAVFEEGG